jgi:hypothetical protein
MADTFNKRFSSGDVFIIPYTANKQWDITSSLFPEYNVFVELGTYPTASEIQDYTRENLIYKSVLSNFYNEFYPTLTLSTSSYYQTINYTSSLTSTDYVVSGGLRIGNPATTKKYYPTGLGSFIYTINIPTSLYSNRILPTTFEMEISGGKIYDDGEYNLLYSGSNQSSSINTIISQSSYVGNLFYEQGLGVLTVVPKSMYTQSVPPPPVTTYEYVAIWGEDFSGTSGATSNWRSTYNYVDAFGFSASVDLFNIPFGVNPYGIFSQTLTQKSGTGYFTTVTGTPLPLYAQSLGTFATIPFPLVPNVTWEIPANSETVIVYRNTGAGIVTDNYTNPFSGNPADPSSLPTNINAVGTIVQAMTYNKGVNFVSYP